MRRKLAGGLGGLLLVATLVACGDSTQATSKPLVSGTPTTGATATTAQASPIISLPGGSPALPRPSGTPLLPRPSASPDLPVIGGQPSASPDLPVIGGQPTVTPSANAVAPNSDGSCPDTHPIKGAQLGPVKNYFLKDQAGYSNARAAECFANETDAEAAGYRKAAR
jgi:hypothetical protein